MKKIENLSAEGNYSAINLGCIADIKDYELELGPEIKIPGKVFGGQEIGRAHV